jgi:hypothetical protein
MNGRIQDMLIEVVLPVQRKAVAYVDLHSFGDCNEQMSVR